MVYRVFISYSTDDIKIRDKLAEELKKYKIDAIFYMEGEIIGEYPAQNIKDLIESCNIAVVILTPMSFFKSPWVQQEIGYAEGVIKNKIKVIPLVVNGLDIKGFTEAKQEVRFPLALWEEGIERCVAFIKKEKDAFESGTLPRKETEHLIDYYSPTRINEG